MMLNKQQHVEIAMLVAQAPNDIAYMKQWVNDPDSHFTRGICERHELMAQWLTRVLEVFALAQPPPTNAVDPHDGTTLA